MADLERQDLIARKVAVHPAFHIGTERAIPTCFNVDAANAENLGLGCAVVAATGQVGCLDPVSAHIALVFPDRQRRAPDARITCPRHGARRG